jgi:iron complex outermembrane receptor protein
MKIHALLLGASALALACHTPASAQTTAPSTVQQAGATAAIQELVVTAERRTTNLQTTPIAATVLTGRDLEKQGVVTIDQLQFVSPSITVNNFGQGNNVNIRGIGKGEHTSTTTVGVITYRDGAASFPGYFQEEPYFDVADVEVLRGPQGTFSGQNATGGAIIVNTQDPKIAGGYTGYLLGRYGNYNDAALQGAVNLPISDTLAARVAFNAEHRSSFFHVSGPWTGDPNLNWGSARLSLLWTPTAQIKVLWKTDYDYLQNGGYFGNPIINPTTGKPNGTNGLFDFANNSHNFATDQFVRSTLKAEYVEPSTEITFRSVTSYAQGRTAWDGDTDGTAGVKPASDNFISEAVNEKLFSEELTVISPDKGPFTWILGGYYDNNRYIFPPNRFTLGFRSLGLSETLNGDNPTETEAVFGQASYDLPHGFQIQAGLRYSHWQNAFHARYVVPQLAAFGFDFRQDATTSGDNVTGKLTLNWNLDADNFLYAFVATGAKPGGINVPLILAGGVTPPPFIQEHVTDYEVGWKSRLFDNHVRLQLGAFYDDFEHFQVSLLIPNQPTQSTVQNVPNNTKLYGVEASVQAAFGDLSGSMGLDLQHSSLGTFYAQDPRVAATGACSLSAGPATATCVNLEGHAQTYAPNFTFNAALQYNFHVGDEDLLTPSVTYAHISDQWATLFANSAKGDHLAARNLWGASVAWTHGDLVTTLYGYNLFDDRYVSALLSSIQLAGAPRQFGISVRKVF